MTNQRFRAIAVATVALGVFAAACTDAATPDSTAVPASPPTAARPPTTATAAPTTTSITPTTTTTTVPVRMQGEVPAWTVGMPWGSVEGLLMFRGNPTRTWHGTGPVPLAPSELWRFPDSAMCGNSPVGGQPKLWCGSGWTGQPVVWERSDGVTEVIFGAYDKSIHFLDALTGLRSRADFPMGDIIKGSVSLDPDGFPLLYAGSRDPNFRILALDRGDPVELWSLSATSVDGMWNNDWDSNAVVVDDIMFQGGENSWWFAVKLNRTIGDDGLVSVDPEVVWSTPAWTSELLSTVGRQQSVENSTAVFGTTAYFANSAGRVVGVDVANVADGEAEIVFDYWVGDDVDATIVIDDQGMLYVAAQVDLSTSRGRELGQLVKLDPSRPDDPFVWGVAVPADGAVDGGIWATPALVGDLVFVPTNPGELLAVDRMSGEVVWRDEIGANAWSSPVHVDQSLIVAVDCNVAPKLRAYDVTDPRSPAITWELPLGGGCIESTPAIWRGQIFVGSRDGFFYSVGEP